MGHVDLDLLALQAFAMIPALCLFVGVLSGVAGAYEASRRWYQ